MMGAVSHCTLVWRLLVVAWEHPGMCLSLESAFVLQGHI